LTDTGCNVPTLKPCTNLPINQLQILIALGPRQRWRNPLSKGVSSRFALYTSIASSKFLALPATECIRWVDVGDRGRQVTRHFVSTVPSVFLPRVDPEFPDRIDICIREAGLRHFSGLCPHLPITTPLISPGTLGMNYIVTLRLTLHGCSPLNSRRIRAQRLSASVRARGRRECVFII